MSISRNRICILFLQNCTANQLITNMFQSLNNIDKSRGSTYEAREDRFILLVTQIENRM